MVKVEILVIGIILMIFGFWIAPVLVTIMSTFGWATTSGETFLISNFFTWLGGGLIVASFIHDPQ